MSDSLQELIEECSDQVDSVGVDLVSKDRLRNMIDRYGQNFLDQVFTQAEQQYCLQFQDPNEHFAGRWAAKEAVSKALGTGISQGVGWKQIEIASRPDGRPVVALNGEALRVSSEARQQIRISISHCSGFAVAFAVASKS